MFVKLKYNNDRTKELIGISTDGNFATGEGFVIEFHGTEELLRLSIRDYNDMINGVVRNEDVNELNMDWDFSKLPQEEVNNVIEKYERRDIVALMLIHNKYKLSKVTYCCGEDGKSALKWFEYGISTGKIKQG